VKLVGQKPWKKTIARWEKRKELKTRKLVKRKGKRNWENYKTINEKPVVIFWQQMTIQGIESSRQNCSDFQ
jgi:hypothetical protein